MNNFLVECFFLFLPFDLESVLNSAFLGTHFDLFEEKSFQLYFKKNIMQSIPTPLLYGLVSVGEMQYIPSSRLISPRFFDKIIFSLNIL